MASATEENYLKALYTLAGRRDKISLSELSKLLKVSLPTSNSMIKKLEIQGFVNYEKYKPITLTAKGKKAAALVLRKHRLTEMYLVEKMGFGWEEVHEIAEQVEHISSSIFFERMDELMGFPRFDPHGSPIPDKDGKMEAGNFDQLSQCKAGDKVRIMALSKSTDEFLKYLNSRSLNLGVILHIKSLESYDNSMVVSYPDHPAETLNHIVSEHLLVEQVS